jgi:mxaD protein
MPRITETATIGLHPQTLWNEIGAFGSVGDWHPLLSSVEVLGEGTGAMRIAHAKEGAEQMERLQTLDPERRLYRYTMEKTSMPVRDYRGEFRIESAGDAASLVVWSARFELTADGDGRTVESVRHFLHAGTESLKHRFGEPGL